MAGEVLTLEELLKRGKERPFYRDPTSGKVIYLRINPAIISAIQRKARINWTLLESGDLDNPAVREESRKYDDMVCRVVAASLDMDRPLTPDDVRGFPPEILQGLYFKIMWYCGGREVMKFFRVR